MNWSVIRHPETKGIGVVAETALLIHKAAGWLRVSEPIDEMDKDQVDLGAYADAPDLDAPKPEPTDAKAAKTSKES